MVALVPSMMIPYSHTYLLPHFLVAACRHLPKFPRRKSLLGDQQKRDLPLQKPDRWWCRCQWGRHHRHEIGRWRLDSRYRRRRLCEERRVRQRRLAARLVRSGVGGRAVEYGAMILALPPHKNTRLVWISVFILWYVMMITMFPGISDFIGHFYTYIVNKYIRLVKKFDLMVALGCRMVFYLQVGLLVFFLYSTSFGGKRSFLLLFLQFVDFLAYSCFYYGTVD